MDTPFPLLSNLTENELKVLKVINEITDNWGECCIYVRHLVEETKLEDKEVRKVCKSLRSSGLIQYLKGLMDDEGKVAGAGYAITYEGQKLMFPCQMCGELAHFAWHENEKGEMVYTDTEGATYFQLCEEHYKAKRDK